METRTDTGTVDCRLVVDGEQKTDFTDYTVWTHDETGRHIYVMDSQDDYQKILDIFKHEGFEAGLFKGAAIGVAIGAVVELATVFWPDIKRAGAWIGGKFKRK